MKFLKKLSSFCFKITLIDFLISALLVFSTPAIIYSYKLHKFYELKKNILVNVGVEFNVKFVELNELQTQQIKPGNKEIDEFTLIMAEILEIYKIVPSSSLPKMHTVYARIQLTGNNKGPDFYYKDQLLNNGSTFYFKNNTHSLKTIILSNPLNDYGDSLPGKWIRLYAKILFKNIPNHLVQEIKKDDSEIAPGGKVMAQMIKILKVQPSMSKICFEEKTFLIKHGDTKDIEAMLILNVKISNQQNFLYRKTPIVPNSNIYFNTFDYTINGFILDIFETLND